MKQATLLVLAAMMALAQAKAEERTIDISGNNTSSDYKSYGTAISLPQGDIVNVKMARYCYFSSKITGSGILNLYGGGDRCFLGNSEKKWPDWTGPDQMAATDATTRALVPFGLGAGGAGAQGVHSR